MTDFPSAAAFAIALGSPNTPPIYVTEETLDFRGVEFLSTLRLLIPTFSLPNAPAALAGQPSMRLECSPTTVSLESETIRVFGNLLSPGKFSAQPAIE